jgi:hypothetical protein
MAVVYGATGNVSIGGLFLAGVVPGVLIGIGLMIYSYIWGPVGVMKPRAKFTEVAVAARGAALPLIIPVIIMGGILTGWFTPTEAGMIACAYILLVLIPVLNPRHIRQLPGDFMYTGLLYSLPLAAVAGASAFGWMLAYLRGPDTVAEYNALLGEGDKLRRDVTELRAQRGRRCGALASGPSPGGVRGELNAATHDVTAVRIGSRGSSAVSPGSRRCALVRPVAQTWRAMSQSGSSAKPTASA